MRRTLYSPLTSSSLRSSCAAPRGGKLGALLPPGACPLLLPPPACMRTFIVSSGWMVLWEAARAMAPATTSCAGFWSGCGGGGGGGATAAGGAASVAVLLLLLELTAIAPPSLPVGCRRGTRGG